MVYPGHEVLNVKGKRDNDSKMATMIIAQAWQKFSYWAGWVTAETESAVGQRG